MTDNNSPKEITTLELLSIVNAFNDAAKSTFEKPSVMQAVMTNPALQEQIEDIATKMGPVLLKMSSYLATDNISANAVSSTISSYRVVDDVSVDDVGWLTDLILSHRNTNAETQDNLAKTLILLSEYQATLVIDNALTDEELSAFMPEDGKAAKAVDAFVQHKAPTLARIAAFGLK